MIYIYWRHSIRARETHYSLGHTPCQRGVRGRTLEHSRAAQIYSTRESEEGDQQEKKIALVWYKKKKKGKNTLSKSERKTKGIYKPRVCRYPWKNCAATS